MLVGVITGSKEQFLVKKGQLLDIRDSYGSLGAGIRVAGAVMGVAWAVIGVIGTVIKVAVAVIEVSCAELGGMG